MDKLPEVGAVFVDGANMSRSLTAKSHDLGGRFLIDYGRLAEALDKRFGMRFVFRTYYTTHKDQESLDRREKFFDHLRTRGWTVFDYPAKFVVNADHPEGIWMDKGIDLAIGLDSYRLALMKQAAIMAVATHDTDFIELFKRLPTGMRAVVIGWRCWLSRDFDPWAEPLYLDDLNVLRG